MRVRGNVVGLALLFGFLTACGGQTFTGQVAEVRKSYAQIWDERMSEYQASLSAAGEPAKIAVDPETKATVAPAPRDFSSIALDQAQQLGRFDTLVAFKAFRHAQPVMSVAQKWLVERWQTHVIAMRDAGVREGEILGRMERLVAGEDVVPIGFASIDYRLGALSETRRLTGEIIEFDRNYRAALRSDLANLPPPTPPPSAAEMQGIINGVISGARIGAGLGR